jgi:nucleoside-diphosphate-sugar epimerase
MFLGSSCIYPKLAPQPLREEYMLTDPLEVTNEPYAVAKIAGIKMVEAYRNQYACGFINVMATDLYTIRNIAMWSLLPRGKAVERRVPIAEFAQLVAGIDTGDTARPDGTSRKLLDVRRLTALSGAPALRWMRASGWLIGRI